MRKIQLFSDKIARQMNGDLDELVSDNLQKITKASERMQLLINDLLKFSRHTQSKEDFIHVDLNKTVEEVLGDFEGDLEAKNARVIVKDLPTIWAIPSQMQQLFQNLVGNSIKFCNQHVQLKIEIWSETVADHTNENNSGHSNVMHRIYINDNGIGFDSKYADDIFVVFKRLHSYHEFEGSGIGLSICKKIAEKHNGSIIAKGVVNKGATFIVTLPETPL